MASIRKFDGRIWLEKGEFEHIPSKLKNKLSYKSAGRMDNYIIGYSGDRLLIYIPIVDAIKFSKSSAACQLALNYQNKDKNK